MQMTQPVGKSGNLDLGGLNCGTKKPICKGCPDKKVSRPKRDQAKKGDLQRSLDKTP